MKTPRLISQTTCVDALPYFVLLESEAESRDDFLRHGRSREKKYAFDHAFSEDVRQREVYEKTTQFLIEGVAEGFNATVFAYGATGAGKVCAFVSIKKYSPNVVI